MVRERARHWAEQAWGGRLAQPAHAAESPAEATKGDEQLVAGASPAAGLERQAEKGQRLKPCQPFLPERSVADGPR